MLREMSDRSIGGKQNTLIGCNIIENRICPTQNDVVKQTSF